MNRNFLKLKYCLLSWLRSYWCLLPKPGNLSSIPGIHVKVEDRRKVLNPIMDVFEKFKQRLFLMASGFRLSSKELEVMAPLVTCPQYSTEVLLTLDEGWIRVWEGTPRNFQLVLYSLSCVVSTKSLQ